ncbi:glycine-rich domain-containing protein [Pseudofrankia asymbiotica]|uniref:Uncharacterized protein n=1 Tax=Pseudofrankia asymbiotica TaxID=1834516 RepID=A0A1V2ID64_9ACTN|nr:hypothetical protein [Pseudofrankia asymbiotica]ONH30819.1 hypothetical protein BL253_11945 [Pseudofrankia asymbiotica]
MTTLAPAPRRSGRDLVDDALFARLTTRIVADHPEYADLAERIVDQTLAFLATSAGSATPMSPSHLVDIGWHTFVLHTREYAQFCARVAGRLIHHVPEHPSEWGITVLTVSRMLPAIERAGFYVDRALWIGEHGDCEIKNCHQCHATCHDSP